MAKGWIQSMIEREAIPKAERTNTILEFCEEFGISVSTYDYQKRKKENKRKIVQIWLNEACNGGNEVLAKLKDNALSGKEKSIEMYLKFVLELTEQLDLKIEDNNKMSYERAKQIISEGIAVRSDKSDSQE